MAQSSLAAIGHNRPRRQGAMYAITFDLNTKTLETTYGSASWQNAYSDIGRFLRQHGFGRQQGSVCFGDDSVDVVRCQLVVQQLAAEFDWFAPAVTDIRMLRIEDNNDLMPAVELALRLKEGPKAARKK